ELEARRLAVELERGRALERAFLEADPCVVPGDEPRAGTALECGAGRLDLEVSLSLDATFLARQARTLGELDLVVQAALEGLRSRLDRGVVQDKLAVRRRRDGVALERNDARLLRRLDLGAALAVDRRGCALHLGAHQREVHRAVTVDG